MNPLSPPKKSIKSPAKSAGFTLIELLIGMTVSLVVMAGVLAFSISLLQANSKTVRTTRVTQDLRMTSEIIMREIKRSGYNQDAIQLIANADIYDNGFDTIQWGETEPAVPGDCPVTIAAEESASCAVFAYDRLGINDTVGGTPSGEEWKGFRRIEVGSERTARGIIQMFVGEAGAEPSCDDAADASGWVAVTPPGIDITKFALSNNQSEPIELSTLPVATTAVRRVGIQIDGIPLRTSLNEYSRQVCDEVRVRADDVNVVTPPAP